MSQPKKFIISVPELHYFNIEVIAKTKKEAFEKAQDLYRQQISNESQLEYSHTIEDMSQWKYEEKD